MNKLLAFLIVLSFTFSCVPDSEIDGPGPRPDNGSLDDLLIFQTDDLKFPMVFVHKNSDRLFARDINENGIYDGFFYKDGNYEEFLIIDEKTGLPTSKRNSEGVLILYSYKEENKMVDLAITINEETSVVRNINVPDNNLSGKTETSGKPKSEFETIRDAADAYQVASNIIGCAEGIGGFLVGTTLSAGIATVPAGLLASAKCTPLALTVAQKLLEATDTEIGQLLANDLKKVNGFVSALTCPSGVAGCTAFVVAEAANLQAKLEELQRKAEQFQKELEEILNRSAEIIMVGDLNFGKVELDDTKTEILTIYNRGDEAITITGLDVNSNPEQFKINVPLPFTIDAAGGEASKAEISITFAPQDAAQDYNTFLKISNNKYEPFDAKAITARASNEEGAKIRFSGALNYDGVSLNKPISATFTILNPNLNDNIEVSSIEFEGSPSTKFKDRFGIIGWNNGTIEPGKKQEIEVVFETPDDVVYEGFVVVKNNLDGVNNKWPIFARGNKIPEFEILEEEVKFSPVKIGKSITKNFRIKNTDTNIDLILTDAMVFSNTIKNEQFQLYEFLSITIKPGETKQITLQFSPTYEGIDLGKLVLNIQGVIVETDTQVFGNGFCKEAPLNGAFTIMHPSYGNQAFLIMNDCTMSYGGCDWGSQTCSFKSDYNFTGTSFSANWELTTQYEGMEPFFIGYSFSSVRMGEDEKGKFFIGTFTENYGGSIRVYEESRMECYFGECTIGFDE